MRESDGSDLDMDDFSDGDENFSPSPAAPKAKKAVAKPKATKPLGATQSQNVQHGGRAIEEVYQKKTQLEHILLRPDTYIGSTEKQQQPLWVHDGQGMVLRAITYAPGLFKIFDEILVNAADNKARDPSMDTVRVDIDAAANVIKVWNNGDGIPVDMHKEEGVYVPELIFGHLLTSSNYNDDEKKVTGGRNGYGAKLANIFSTSFTVETCDGRRLRRFKQTWRNNMSVKDEPRVTACKASDNWTCVTFSPDLAKFDMEALEEDVVALMRKRVYDTAGVLGKTVKVYLNGTRLPIKSFSDYVDLYLGPKEGGVARVFERVGDRWEVCVSATEGQFQQVSFVNSICTSKGGTHVNHVVDQMSKFLVEKLNKKHKKANIKPFMVKNHLWVFLNSQIENPAFDSQTKDTLTTKVSSFGSKCELPATMLERVARSGVIDNILSFADFKNQKELKKSDGAKRSRLIGITKLSDANEAGTRNSGLCTLILTEGDSAKSLAMSGLSVVGHDHYGVFPLRGKLLNVRDATAAQVSENQEIQHIKQILGLQHGRAYDDAKALRYGHLMIMTDQDHDGSHIKGLIMNFLHTFYPSLLRMPGFLVEFITPIIKARKGQIVRTFYTMPEYEAWRETLSGSASTGWDIKYYKGLGTSSSAEAKQYFANMTLHRKEFVWEGDDDGAAIEMAFSKKRVEDRKRWLSGFVPGTYLDQSAERISYADFVHKELVLFSRADLERSIPCMVDGLKPGQRKILYCAFKRNLRRDIKVAQLAGYVSEHSAYHHGEASLQATIVGLAQDFVGSNNINLLYPSGQFGTRLQGGKDAASPRYIYTRLAPLTRALFHRSDDKLLTYLEEEGQSIEPEWYMPVLPLVLVNGAEGIGTGWSTFIPNYSPRDIVANIKRLLHGQPLEPMQPWYRGFKGSIVEVPSKTGGRSYAISGTATWASEAVLDITELPVRKWTQDYKEFLEGLLKGGDKAKEAAKGKAKAKDSEDSAPATGSEPLLADYKEHHTDLTVHFSCELLPGKAALLQQGLETRLKLTTRMSTGNMMLFDAEGKIRRYESPEEILTEFFGLRLDYYERRRVSLLEDARWEHMRASNKIRFILAVVDGSLRVAGRKRADIEVDLEAGGWDRMTRKQQVGINAPAPVVADKDDGEEGEAAGAAAAAAAAAPSYDYLLSMAIWSLTREKVAVLQDEAAAAEAVVARLSGADIRSMWEEDLDAFLQAYEAWEVEEAAAVQQLARQQLKARGGKKAAAAAKAKGGKKKANPWSDEDGDGDDVMDLGGDDDDDEPKAAPKPRKPAAPRAPRAAPAAAAPKPPAAPAAAAAAPVVPAQPQYRVPTAAPPKAPKAGAKAAAAAAASAQPTAPAAPKPAAAPASDASAPAQGSEPLSLAERLKRMAIRNAQGAASSSSSAASEGAATSAAAPKPPRRAAAAARATRIVEDDSDDDVHSTSSRDDDDDDSTASDSDDAAARPKAGPSKPAAAKARAAPAAARGRLPAAPAASASPATRVAFGRTVASPSAAQSPAVKKAAPKRKPAGKQADAAGAPKPEGGYEAPTPSPAVMRQKKARAVSPLPAPKGLAQSKAAAAPAAAGAAARPARAARQTAAVSYRDQLGSDSDGGSSDDDDDAVVIDSEYEDSDA